MARKAGSTIVQEELYPQADERREADDALDDARLLDLDVEQESPFLRGQKRVSVRRGSLPKKTATHLTWGVLVLGIVVVCGTALAALYHYGEQSWRFRIESSDDLEIGGLGNVTRSQVMEVMGGDIGRNIFFVPLAQRQKQLEQIPWVESASVMRFVPNRLRIEIHERTPVAFARVGSKILLVDADGSLMELPVVSRKKYSFPVILGMNLDEPHSTRSARMKIYNDLVSQLDSGGARYAQDLSEVDLSDADDVKVLASDPGGEVLVHLGSSDYLDRYKVYVSHVREWRQQFERLDSVDLRYDRQIVVNPDLEGAMKPPPLSMPATKAAMAAGVKPAALITHQGAVPKPASAAPRTVAAKISAPRLAAKRKTARTQRRRTRPALQKASARPGAASASASNAVKASNKPSPGIPREQGQQ